MSADALTRAAIAGALRARYPGVSRVRIEWLADDPCNPGYRGWRIEFHATLETLVRHALIAQADIDRTAAPWNDDAATDEFGHSRYLGGDPAGDRRYLGIHVPELIPEGHHTERRVHTKKMQRQVARLLRRAFALPKREARR